jgi:hypothetical protein
MSVHTPGPWSAKNDGREPIAPGVVILDDDNACGDPECCGPPTYWISIKREDANLIAAAPDLLDSLEDLLEVALVLRPETVGDEMDKEARIAYAQFAIAKATGEQP